MSFEIETFNRAEIYLAEALADGSDARASVKGKTGTRSLCPRSERQYRDNELPVRPCGSVGGWKGRVVTRQKREVKKERKTGA